FFTSLPSVLCVFYSNSNPKMLKVLIASLVLLSAASAQSKKEQAACAKEVAAKVKAEPDLGLRISVITGLFLQGLGDEHGLKRIADGLTPERKDRVRNYYLIGACLPFQSKLD
ncbi:hypothetical protein PMAYCL1PPCAC_13451, partial [Pristionchus mayeri]